MLITFFSCRVYTDSKLPGGEWEPIRIPHQNLAYVPKQTQRVSLLTRSRSHSYRRANGPRNRTRDSGITAEDHNRSKQSHVWVYGDQDWITKQLKLSRTFHRTHCGRVWETTVRVWFGLRKVEPLIQWLQNNTGFHLQQSRTTHAATKIKSCLGTEAKAATGDQVDALCASWGRTKIDARRPTPAEHKP
jgi:hypothetical protein